MDAPEDLDRLIQEALTELGLTADPAALAQKVKLLNLGLPAEDEFSVICAWLGQCRLVHKLDQLQAPPASNKPFQVPDLLAAFGHQGTFLIEVKVCAKQKLSFRADYMARLNAYADLLGKPLLIAWKYHAIWTLFDVRQMKLAKTNFNIKHGEAMKQNLLGVLVGDVVFKLAPGAGVHFEMTKEELLGVEHQDESTYTEQWRMRISEVGFTKGGGVAATGLHAETQQLLTAWDLEEHETHSERAVLRSYVAGDEGMQFAHMALIHVLAWERGAKEADDWRTLLRTAQITKTIENFPRALDRALKEGVVSHIFHQQPVEMPDFLIQPAGSDEDHG